MFIENIYYSTQAYICAPISFFSLILLLWNSQEIKPLHAFWQAPFWMLVYFLFPQCIMSIPSLLCIFATKNKKIKRKRKLKVPQSLELKPYKASGSSIPKGIITLISWDIASEFCQTAYIILLINKLPKGPSQEEI